MEPETRRFSDLDQMSRSAAAWIVAEARRLVREQGAFTLVLSGGHTPKGLYRELAGPSLNQSMPWGETHVFWGDERCVPPDHQFSNYATAWETFLSVAPIPQANIYRIPAEISPPEKAAREYEITLREIFGSPESGARSPQGSGVPPSFDVVLLGMGSDGHTASLFPGDHALEERRRWVVAVPGHNADPPVPRITMTLPLINEARSVVFLISGREKKMLHRTILSDPKGAGRLYPAARVRPEGRLIWFMN